MTARSPTSSVQAHTRSGVLFEVDSLEVDGAGSRRWVAALVRELDEGARWSCSRAVRVYLATAPVSLRKSFDGLSNEVREVLKRDP